MILFQILTEYLSDLENTLGALNTRLQGIEARLECREPEPGPKPSAEPHHSEPRRKKPGRPKATNSARKTQSARTRPRAGDVSHHRPVLHPLRKMKRKKPRLCPCGCGTVLRRGMPVCGEIWRACWPYTRLALVSRDPKARRAAARTMIQLAETVKEGRQRQILSHD